MRDPEDGKEYAVKTELTCARVPQLMIEYRVYRSLFPTEGIPTVYAQWTRQQMEEGEMVSREYMAMEVLGPSLQACMKDVTQDDIMRWIFPKTIKVVERMHGKSFLHRDIKPDNILLGRDGLRGKKVYLVDFGLSKRFRYPDHTHIPYRNQKVMTGTVRYASVRTHLGEQQSRRDDLESLGYVMVYLMKGRLPWMGLEAEDPLRLREVVKQTKLNTSPAELCEGLPTGVFQYFRYVRSLSFEQSPDYALLRGFFCE